MENNLQRWVNLGFLVMGVLAALLVSYALTRAIPIFDLETKVKNVQVVRQIVSLVFGAVVAFFLYRHPKVSAFANEVALELSRVTWPSNRDTNSGTVVVVIMVIVSGLILGLLDYVWTEAVRLFL
jgi:preprotein translocase subunit SecE